MDVKVRKDHNLLRACWRAYGATLGQRPKAVHWLYVFIIPPSIIFASLVWWSDCQTASAKETLSRLERLACLVITGTRRITATGAMEALTGLPALDQLIQGEAKSTVHRLRALGCWSYFHPNRGHSSILLRLREADPIFNKGADVIRPAFNLEPKYRVTMLTKEDWTTGTAVVEGPAGFTDGSRTKEGTGAGVYG